MFKEKVIKKLNSQNEITDREFCIAFEITTKLIKNEFKKGVKEDHAATLVAFCINCIKRYNLEY